MADVRWRFDASSLTGAEASPVPNVDETGRPMVRMRLLGAAAMLVGENRLDSSSDTMFALLLRASLGAGRAVGRDQLLRTFWPGQSESRQRANLRQTLYKLRLLGVRIGLAGDTVRVDGTQIAPTFSVERTSRRFIDDVLEGREPFGVFLPGYAPTWPEYDEWVVTQRDTVHAEIRRVLVEVLRGARDAADWSRADTVARWVLQFDPFNEEATLTVAECLAMNGSKADAVAMIDRYLDELGSEAGDLRLSATLLRRRISEPQRRTNSRLSFASSERHFVGREDLMAELTLAMRNAKWRSGNATLLYGPAGIGKTRVTEELSKVAVIEGFRVITVECRESDQQRPLSVFLELIPVLLDLPGAMGCDPEHLQLLQRLIAQDFDGDRSDIKTSTTNQSPLPLPSVVNASVVELLSNICFESTVLLIIEDVQWADELSELLLADLVASVNEQRLSLLMTSRAEHIRQLAKSTASGLLTKPISRISDSSSARLALGICADFGISCENALLEWFVSAGEGIPFFVRALVGHWIETGIAGGVPPTLYGLIEQRLQMLDPEALLAVQAGSLLGKYATIETLDELLAFSLPKMIQIIGQLSSADTYVSVSTGRLTFHELVARHAIVRLPDASRQLLHLHVARLLQSNRFPIEGSVAVDVIHHLSRGGATDELTRYALAQARCVLDAGKLHLCLAICEAVRALGVDHDHGEFRAIEIGALHRAGQHNELLSRFPDAFEKGSDDPSWDENHADEVVQYLDASRHSQLPNDRKQLISRLALLATSPKVNPDLRVKAALVALRIATNTEGSHDLALVSFEAGFKAAQYSTVPDRAANELLMHYHTVFGDASAALLAANWLQEHLNLYASRLDQLACIANTCYAMRICGDAHAAYSVCRMRLPDAVEAGLMTTAAMMCWSASLIALDWFANPALAASWIDRPECKTIEIERQQAGVVILETRMRIALAQKDLVAAGAISLQLTESEFEDNGAFRTAYRTALKLALAIDSSNVKDIEKLTVRAQELFQITKLMVGQEFLAYQIYRAVTLSDRVDAAAIMVAYCTKSRRADLPKPHYLDDAFKASSLLLSNTG